MRRSDDTEVLLAAHSGSRMPHADPSATEVAEVAEAQRRLVLALRAHHGPRLPALWADACRAAGVLAAGRLTLDELDAVTAVLLAAGGVDAVAAGSCRVRLALARRAAPVPRQRSEDDAGPLDGHHLCAQDVRAALHQPDALDEQTWRRRLAELEREFAPPDEARGGDCSGARARADAPPGRT